MKTLFLLASFLVPAALAQNKLSARVSGTSMFRGNPQHTGVYDSTGVPAFHKIKWKFHTPGFVISSPAIDASTACVGSTDGNLCAVNLATGDQKRKFATEARITSSPAIERGTVYFSSYDGKFYAVDASTGKLKWKFQTAGGGLVFSNRWRAKISQDCPSLTAPQTMRRYSRKISMTTCWSAFTNSLPPETPSTSAASMAIYTPFSNCVESF
jgi:hypothetical protein